MCHSSFATQLSQTDTFTQAGLLQLCRCDAQVFITRWKQFFQKINVHRIATQVKRTVGIYLVSLNPVECADERDKPVAI